MSRFSHYNPVRIEFGGDVLNELDGMIGRRRALLLTSPGFVQRRSVAHLQSLTPSIGCIVSSISPNPTFSDLRKIYDTLNPDDFDVIVALGGGSVLDSAKVLSVHRKNSRVDFSFVETLIKDGPSEPSSYDVKPKIAIPTTAGTGSEVTPWATVWDREKKRKYSLHLQELWFEACICDPKLTLSVPKDVTIQTGLDALSHCFESIWNKHATPFSLRLAADAAKIILNTLPKLVLDLESEEYREQMMLAALQAGMAIANTQTALAHAMSYYVTAHYGVPHGIACSFTLPDIIDALLKKEGKNATLRGILTDILSCSSTRGLRDFYKNLGVSTHMRDYGLGDQDIRAIKESLIGNTRAANSLLDPEDFFKLANH